MTRLPLRALFAASVLLSAAPAWASPVNPWGAHVGKKVVAITPFLYGDSTPYWP